MNNEEKILAILSEMQEKQGKTEAILEAMQADISGLKQGQAKLEQGQAETNRRLDKLEEQQAETHNNLIRLENTIAPKINAIYETRSDLYPRVEKLENTVEKLKFGSEVIRLVEMIEKKR